MDSQETCSHFSEKSVVLYLNTQLFYCTKLKLNNQCIKNLFILFFLLHLNNVCGREKEQGRVSSVTIYFFFFFQHTTPMHYEAAAKQHVKNSHLPKSRLRSSLIFGRMQQPPLPRGRCRCRRFSSTFAFYETRRQPRQTMSRHARTLRAKSYIDIVYRAPKLSRIGVPYIFLPMERPIRL